MALSDRLTTQPSTGDSGARESLPTRFSHEVYLTACAVVVAVVLSYWPTLCHMADRWANEPQYSHGFLVPVFALALLWSRREMLKRAQWQPAWVGLPLLLTAVCVRLLAIQVDLEALGAVSLLPTLLGTVLLVGGWSVLSWSWPAITFLAFMMPLPYFIEVALALPLRNLATVMSTYALQTLGCPAMADGNIILIDDIRLGVEDACSGLGMLMTFFALATAVALVVSVPLWQRLALVGSAVPIAILVNILRITATGLAYAWTGKDSPLAQMIYHDLAGWLMMPAALAMLWLELQFLSHLLIEEPDEAPLPLLKPKHRSATADSIGQTSG